MITIYSKEHPNTITNRSKIMKKEILRMGNYKKDIHNYGWLEDENGKFLRFASKNSLTTILGNIYLRVPYNEKDFAKGAGCYWDANNKLWFYYNPDGILPSSLSKYQVIKLYENEQKLIHDYMDKYYGGIDPLYKTKKMWDGGD
jgi:hypothetical protein